MLKPPPILNDLPVTLSEKGRVIYYPTEVLAPRESFFVPRNKRRPESITSAIYLTIRRAKALFPRANMQFIVRRVRENGVEGVRCWRIR